MVDRFPEEVALKDFQSIHAVVNANTANPQAVGDGLQALKTEASADRNILASFKAISQGKKIMSMVEEALEGKKHVLKVASDLKDICSRCESYTDAVTATKLEDSVRYFTTEASSVRSLAAKVAADDSSGKSMLQCAVDVLFKFAKALLNQHCQSEAKPWLAIQLKTLRASKVISKAPGFGIMNVNDILEKATGQRFAGLDDISGFYNATSSLSTETDTLLRMAGEDSVSAALRECSVMLCRKFQCWSDSLEKLLISCPELTDASAELNKELQLFVSDTSVQVWHAAIAMPKEAFLVFMQVVAAAPNPIEGKDDGLPPIEDLNAAISDAKLLATGPYDTKQREILVSVTGVVEAMVNTCHFCKNAQKHHVSGSVRKAFDAFILCGFLPSECALQHGLHEQVNIDRVKLSEEVLTKEFKELIEDHRRSVKDITEAEQKMEPFPVYTEGNEKSFLLNMMQNNRHKQLTSLSDEMQTRLDTVTQDATVLNVQPETILPEFSFASAERTRWLSIACLATCLRILGSKASGNLSMAIKNSLDKTIEFKELHNLDVPEPVIQQMRDLSKRIEAASNPKKRKESQ
ncbi:unnamed protein product [Durusdinium trenchii]|uniref:Uncharacterized protein n=1 Tax=Durusdinium trenchii TaxID=1381693 RepID=A0ABP0PSE4_9DINO